MDGVAAKHEVIKINMVGSHLYYAVGGQNHALVLAEFVHECYYRMPRWMKHLSESYGPATRELKFQCGIDSGSFLNGEVMADLSMAHATGSAVRVATELVSDGAAGRVLVSKNTARTLKTLKRSKWLEPVEGIVIAGQETYWLRTDQDFLETTKSRILGNSLLRRLSSGQSRKDSSLRLGSSRKSIGGTRTSIGSMGSLSSVASFAVPSPFPTKSTRKGPQGMPRSESNESQATTTPPPPPLKAMKKFPPSQIDVCTSSEENPGVFPYPDRPVADETEPDPERDLGYENVESKTFEHMHEEEEDCDGDFIQQRMIEMAEKKERLIEWSFDMLKRCLEEILAARTVLRSKKALGGLEDQLGKGSNILEQCKEFISIPIFSKIELRERKAVGTVKLTDAAETQLRDYVTKIANHYHDDANMFHNFEHAANVTASMRKMFKQLVGDGDAIPSGSDRGGLIAFMNDTSGRSLFSRLSTDSSFGIKADPLIKFSMLFCSLIHDGK